MRGPSQLAANDILGNWELCTGKLTPQGLAPLSSYRNEVRGLSVNWSLQVSGGYARQENRLIYKEGFITSRQVEVFRNGWAPQLQ
jgi:hypothetical protein